jgi:hypothetical protein
MGVVAVEQTAGQRPVQVVAAAVAGLVVEQAASTAANAAQLKEFMVHRLRVLAQGLEGQLSPPHCYQVVHTEPT